jgi:hypothetical protein
MGTAANNATVKDAEKPPRKSHADDSGRRDLLG